MVSKDDESGFDVGWGPFSPRDDASYLNMISDGRALDIYDIYSKAESNMTSSLSLNYFKYHEYDINVEFAGSDTKALTTEG